MIKIFTFKKRKDFVRVAKGEYIATRNVVLQATHSLSDNQSIYIGYTATKKIGNAVTRNRAKRRLRAIARELFIQYGNANFDYILIARATTPSCNYADLKQDLTYALKKIKNKFNETKQNVNNIQTKQITNDK